MEVVELAIQLRAQYDLRTPDALHAATDWLISFVGQVWREFLSGTVQDIKTSLNYCFVSCLSVELYGDDLALMCGR